MTMLVRPVTEQDHSQGPVSARVTLVEYGDFECPHCGRAFPVVEEVQRKMGDRLRFVFRHFPLSEAHLHAELAAEAAEAAGVQGQFWKMHHELFTHQNALDPASLLRYAEHIGIDTMAFSHQLAERTFRSHVRTDFMSGARSGVNGTPTFFINGVRYDGFAEVQALVVAIDAAEVHVRKTAHA